MSETNAGSLKRSRRNLGPGFWLGIGATGIGVLLLISAGLITLHSVASSKAHIQPHIRPLRVPQTPRPRRFPLPSPSSLATYTINCSKRRR
jgi:hypothetical protein